MKTKELNSLITQGSIFLLDVRTPLEFRQGFLRDSVNLPLDRLLEGGHFDIPEGKKVCLICQSGKRAERARQYLAGRGITAEVLDDGMNAWQESNLPVERESGTHGVTLIRQVQIVIGLLNIAAFLLAWLLSPYWLIIPLFTSCGLLFAGITGFCGLAVILSKMPWNRVE